jgi:hypothetical protein
MARLTNHDGNPASQALGKIGTTPPIKISSKPIYNNLVLYKAPVPRKYSDKRSISHWIFFHGILRDRTTCWTIRMNFLPVPCLAHTMVSPVATIYQRSGANWGSSRPLRGRVFPDSVNTVGFTPVSYPN